MYSVLIVKEPLIAYHQKYVKMIDHDNCQSKNAEIDFQWPSATQTNQHLLAEVEKKHQGVLKAAGGKVACVQPLRVCLCD